MPTFLAPALRRQLTIIEALLVGGAEIYRNTELDLEKRIYPGGVFDPLGLTAASAERTFNLKTAEIKHGRLAMVAFLGERTCLVADHLQCTVKHCAFTMQPTIVLRTCRDDKPLVSKWGSPACGLPLDMTRYMVCTVQGCCSLTVPVWWSVHT